MELISIIVPVYNVEKYIDECINSIVNQTFRNLEIILIDDGSSDNSSKICDEWANRDSRIKVVHVKNGGAGKARNVGLEIAQGDIIGFLDSDDYISPCFYEYLYSLLLDCDVAECDYVVTGEEHASFSKFNTNSEIKSCSCERALYYHIKDRIFKQVIWNKLYRKSVIGSVRFPEGKLIDDEFWTYKVLGNCKKLVHSNLVLYAYRQQNMSIMNSKYSVRRLEALEAKFERLDYISHRFPTLITEATEDLVLTCFYQAQKALKNLQGNEQKEAINTIRKYYSMLDFTKCNIKKIKLTNRFWIWMSKLSFWGVCNLRNLFKIGL